MAVLLYLQNHLLLLGLDSLPVAHLFHCLNITLVTWSNLCVLKL